MPLSDIAIINMALGHLGDSQVIAARTELSNERIVADVFYDQAVEVALEGYAWGFATKTITLGLVEDFTALTTFHEWDFSYRYPDDCVKVRRIVSSLGRHDPNPPPFVIGADDTARLIYTNQIDAMIVYTRLVTDTALFSALFGEAVSWWLAGLMAPGLAKEHSRAQECFSIYQTVIRTAQAADRNESQEPIPDMESEAIRARA